ncbi:hypothetical protein MP228_012876 [Amoeboaphelidium protococcarum]|nr:hypothetical protein MP228_012876 [Amoeboaphelidium protococcarum]
MVDLDTVIQRVEQLQNELAQLRSDYDQKLEDQMIAYDQKLEDQMIAYDQKLEEQKISYDQKLEDQKTQISQLQSELAKIQIRDLLSTFGTLFCNEVGKYWTEPVKVERNVGQYETKLINFTSTNNLRRLVEVIRDKNQTTPVGVSKAIKALDQVCGGDSVALALYCHEHQGNESVFNDKAHPLLKYLAQGGSNDLESAATEILQNLTPISKEVATRVLQAVVTKQAKQSTKVTRSIASMELRSQTPTQTDIPSSKRSSSVQSSQKHKKYRK